MNLFLVLLLLLHLLKLLKLLLLVPGPGLLTHAAQLLDPGLALLPLAEISLLPLAPLLPHDAPLGAPPSLEAAPFVVGDGKRSALGGIGGGYGDGSGVSHGAVGRREELGPATGDTPGVELDIGLGDEFPIFGDAVMVQVRGLALVLALVVALGGDGCGLGCLGSGFGGLLGVLGRGRLGCLDCGLGGGLGGFPEVLGRGRGQHQYGFVALGVCLQKECDDGSSRAGTNFGNGYGRD